MKLSTDLEVRRLRRLSLAVGDASGLVVRELLGLSKVVTGEAMEASGENLGVMSSALMPLSSRFGA